MVSIVMQLQSAYRQYEDPGFMPSVQTGRRHNRRIVLSPDTLRAEDAALRAAIAHDPHLNVLVQCMDVSTRSALEVLTELCPRTPHVCVVPGYLDLPADDSRPFLIGDVGTLTLQQQVALYDWIDRGHEAAQIISLTSLPLWPLVTNGRFLEGLFYRLNVLSIQAASLV
jgi:hypothetical protein